ncbi:MAG: glucose-1-phosphate adenylyltransferase subunit GlgD [Bacillota bacterium]
MNRAIGLIFCNYLSDSLQGIARDRPVGAVPFGGRYRLLDFVLSSMVNSGLRTVGLVTPHHYRPIVDHLGAGKEWFLDRKAGGLFLLPGSNHVLAGKNIKFSLKDLQVNVEFLEKDYAEHVILSGCNQVFNINFQKALEFQNNKEADATLLYKVVTPDAPASPGGLWLEACGEGRAKKIFQEGFEDFNPAPKRPKKPGKRFLDMLIIRRKLLMEIIAGCVDETADLVEAIGENLKSLKVYAYPHPGYWARIDSVYSYFRHNLELLDPKIRNELFMGRDRIHTKIKDNPPARYGSGAMVKNCLIASGCYIEGRVEKSIIFREVQIDKGAQIKNAVVMQRCTIGKDVVLENVILDKFVQIKDHTVLKGTRNYPVVLNKRSVV